VIWPFFTNDDSFRFGIAGDQIVFFPGLPGRCSTSTF
jgi:hypothetical protein